MPSADRRSRMKKEEISMSIPFDPKELEITGYQKGFNPALPGTPLFSFPIPSKDNYKALLADHKGN